jgi:hypothetical protein
MPRITPYKRGVYPLIEGNDRVFFDGEFRKIEECLKSVIDNLKAPYRLPDATIASGVVTIGQASPTTINWLSVDTEAAGATDNLDTISWGAGTTAQIVTFYAASGARTVVFKDGTGNLHLEGDMSLDSSDDNITLQYFSGSGWWELARVNAA